MDPSAVTPDGRLPNADVGEPGVDKSDGDHLRDIFYRMGFGDQEIVALSGPLLRLRLQKRGNRRIGCSQAFRRFGSGLAPLF